MATVKRSAVARGSLLPGRREVKVEHGGFLGQKLCRQNPEMVGTRHYTFAHTREMHIAKSEPSLWRVPCATKVGEEAFMRTPWPREGQPPGFITSVAWCLVPDSQQWHHLEACSKHRIWDPSWTYWIITCFSTSQVVFMFEQHRFRSLSKQGDMVMRKHSTFQLWNISIQWTMRLYGPLKRIQTKNPSKVPQMSTAAVFGW